MLEWMVKKMDNRQPKLILIDFEEYTEIVHQLSEYKKQSNKGKWKVVKMAYGGYDRVCSNCNCNIWLENEWNEMSNEYKNFCPRCGADMRGEDNG